MEDEEWKNITKIENKGSTVIISTREGMLKRVRSLQYQNHHYVLDPSGTHTTIFGQKCRMVKSWKYAEKGPDKFETDITSAWHWAIEQYKKGNLQVSKEWRILYFDIETKGSIDTTNTPAEIISISSYDSFKKEMKFWCIPADPSHQHPNITHRTEAAMLEDFADYMMKFDIITGWNTIKFDCPYFINRYKKLGLTKYQDYMWTKEGGKQLTGFKKEIKSFIRTVNIVDLIVVFMKIVEWLLIRPPDYRLETISKMFLGGAEVKMELKKSPWQIWIAGDYDTLKEYNDMDTKLCYIINDKFGLTAFLQNTQELTPCLNLEETPYNSKVIDSYILSHFDMVFPSKGYFDNGDEEANIKGAMVFDPTPGFHDNVAIFDFSGMYPNIIRTFNISPDTFDMVNGDIVIGDNKFTSRKIGLLNKIVTEFINMRSEYKKKKNEYQGKDDEMYKLWYYKESCVKKIINSIYGVFGYSGFRLYMPQIADSITYIGRGLLQFTKDVATSNGFEVIYGDTDSIFIKYNAKDKSVAEIDAEFERLLNIINERLIDYVRLINPNVHKNTLKIEYETLFTKMVMTGAKKRYVGLVSKWKGNLLQKEDLYFKGIELVRKDTPTGIKTILTEIVWDIFRGEPVGVIMDKIEKSRRVLKEMKPTSLIVYKNLTMEIEQYTTLPQHARAAKYSNDYLGTNFSKENYKGGMIYISRVREGLPSTDVIFLEPDMDIPEGFEIDYERYFEDFVLNKIRLTFGDDYYTKLPVQHYTTKNRTLTEWFGVSV